MQTPRINDGILIDTLADVAIEAAEVSRRQLNADDHNASLAVLDPHTNALLEAIEGMIGRGHYDAAYWIVRGLLDEAGKSKTVTDYYRDLSRLAYGLDEARNAI